MLVRLPPVHKGENHLREMEQLDQCSTQPQGGKGSTGAYWAPGEPQTNNGQYEQCDRIRRVYQPNQVLEFNGSQA